MWASEKDDSLNLCNAMEACMRSVALGIYAKLKEGKLQQGG